MEFALVALWLGVSLALLYAGGTVANVLFPRFADRGLGVALPLSLTVLWTATWVLGHISIALGVWTGVGLVVALAALAASRGATVDRSLYLETALVFSLAFALLVAIRSVDPAIQPIGGEKFLDYGLLKSLLRADSLPPEDMWFAGEPVRYYYGGHLLAAALTRLTGTEGQYAYNLALSGFYATLVTAVYGLAGSLGAHRGLSRRVAGCLGAFLVGVASNLYTPGRVVLWLLPESLARTVADAAGLPIPENGIVSAGPSAFSYWDASRVITDDADDFVGYDPAAAFVIDEFPFFAWLNGDMHAHMMSTSFLLLVAALCFAYYTTPADRVWRRRGLVFGCLPVVAGMLAVTNTWSFPAVGGLVVLTVAMAPADPSGLLPGLRERFGTYLWQRELRRLVVAVVAGALVLALGVVVSAPFWLGAAGGREIGFLPDRTSLGELLVVHGPFLFAFASYLFLRAGDALDRNEARIGALASVVVVGLGAAVDLAAVGLFVPLVLSVWALRRGPSITDQTSAVTVADGGTDGGYVGFEGVLLIAGIGLMTVVEFVALAENVGRMNTLFKVYMQVWVLWAPAAGVALAYVGHRWPRDREVEWRGVLARTFVVLLVCSTALYAGFALSNHAKEYRWTTGGQGPTLNGTAWADEAHPQEMAAIRHLDRTVDERPTMVTAAPAGYRWAPGEGKGASAPASLTGIPTVAGWYHERQYRNDTVYERRLADVETIYTGDATRQAALLRLYDVAYVYVGPVERARYGEITVDSLDAVRVVYENEAVTVYRVRPGALQGG